MSYVTYICIYVYNIHVYMSHIHVYICMSVLFITLGESLDVSTQQYSDVEKEILNVKKHVFVFLPLSRN